MSLSFSKHPGPRERHLRRKYTHPGLFACEDPPLDQIQVDQALLDQARLADEQELNHFLRYFRDLVQEAIDLKPETDSQIILDIKARLDRCYTHCCALPGEQSEIKKAVSTLIEVIMKAVRQGAANDPIASNTLNEEDIARRMYKELHEYPIVADLLLPDCPIPANELVPALLCEAEDALTASLQIFDEPQCRQIFTEAEQLIATQSSDQTSVLRRKLDIMQAALKRFRT